MDASIAGLTSNATPGLAFLLSAQDLVAVRMSGRRCGCLSSQFAKMRPARRDDLIALIKQSTQIPTVPRQDCMTYPGNSHGCATARFSQSIPTWREMFKLRSRSPPSAFVSGSHGVVGGGLFPYAYDLARNLTGKHFQSDAQSRIDCGNSSVKYGRPNSDNPI